MMADATSKRKEVRFTGFGGQGMAVVGYILGRAAAVHDGKNATMTQSYGPEARGGASSSQVIISDGRVFYPYVIESDVLVGMSQEGYDKHYKTLKSEGKLLIDEDLVTVAPDETAKHVFKGMEGESNAVVGNTTLGEIVGTNLLRALPGANLSPPLSG